MAKNNVQPGATPSYAGWKAFAEHLLVIFVFNAVLAAVVFLSNDQGPVNWSLLVISLVAQGVLALLDSLKQYMLAYNQPGIAGVIGLAEQDIQARAPGVKLPAAATIAQQQFNSAWQPQVTQQPQFTSASQVPASQPTPATAQAAQPTTIDTLPLIHAVQPTQNS